MAASAIGLVEAHAYVAAITAADVQLAGRLQKVDPGLMTVVVKGEVAAVQAAVAAGAEAAARVGTLVSAHVIPRPDYAAGRLAEGR